MEALFAWTEDPLGAQAGVVFLLVFARIAPIALFAPWLVFRDTELSLRIGIGLALAAALLPLALAGAPAPSVVGGFPFALLLLREVLVGGVFALATSLPFFAFGWAGELVDQFRGSSWGGFAFGSAASSPLGALYLLSAIALFAALGGHRFAISAFADGLLALPVGAAMAEAGVLATGLSVGKLVGHALVFSIAVALPAGLAIALVELAFGIAARVAPAFPAVFAAFPLRAIVALAMAMLGVSFALTELPAAFRDAFATASRLLDAFRP